MLKIRLIVIVVMCFFIPLIKPENNSGVHLLLKNVNYHPYRKQVNKRYDVLDFSIYLPKTTITPKPSVPPVQRGTLAYAGHITHSGTIEQPPVRKLKSSQHKNYREGLPTNTAPYFESLSGVMPQKLKAQYNLPFYAPAPPAIHNVQSQGNKFSVKLPKYSATIQHSSPTTISNPPYLLPTTLPVTKSVNIPNGGVKTEIYYGSNGTPQQTPRFEAYTVHKPLARTEPLIHRNVNSPHFEALTAPKPESLSAVARNPNVPYYESRTTHDSTEYQNSQAYNPQVHVQQGEELIHQSPVKELLLNNIVYHDDSYTNLSAARYENSQEDDDSDESYQVSEHPQESKKYYQKSPPTQTVLPFLISVQDPPKQGTSNQQTFTEHITPQPLVAELSLAPPFSSNASRDNLRDAKKRGRTPARNASGKGITDEVKYFQDIFVSQNTPYDLEFGHILESPKLSEERFEKKDLKEERHRGKVRWTDKKGGYGEHYWDLGHSKRTS